MVRLIDCQPGLFIYDNTLCLKTEYFYNERVEAYVVSSGEYFSPGQMTDEEYNNLMVYPVFWMIEMEIDIMWCLSLSVLNPYEAPLESNSKNMNGLKRHNFIFWLKRKLKRKDVSVVWVRIVLLIDIESL